MRFRVNMRGVTQGSVTAIPVRRKSGKTGAVVIHSHSTELYELRAVIQSEFEKNGGVCIENQPIGLEIEFGFVRPKSVSEKKRPFHTVKPDIDKLGRAILDALTNVAYKDDSQVTQLLLKKKYADEDYIDITII